MGRFPLCVFDEWLKEDVGNYYIQLFDSTLANWVGEQPGVCTLARTCGHAGVMEFNGDVYACDHFVFPEYKLGNIQTKTLTEMMYSPVQQKLERIKKISSLRNARNANIFSLAMGNARKTGSSIRRMENRD